MTPRVRRVVYVASYEFIAILMVGVSLAVLLGEPLLDTGSFAVLTSLIAVGWNYVYTVGFEWWEARQTVKGRSTRRRVAHAAGFEIGLMVLLAPFMSWWLSIPLAEALVYEISFALFFVCYTYLFNLAFDKIFGLPQSAQ
ncbi:PACE efflux transporter [Rhizobium sp. C1]|uniref:PACE efflux transporter n=1 Tax=Rhizobium sp. C1 TaxID=1349799 RepID=UPI001E31AA77|nr:PACE efflux transporter [Rhizobium sp. C1]MCD2177623.1 PACE efflux transporter [Rhizobium sp. C1]